LRISGDTVLGSVVPPTLGHPAWALALFQTPMSHPTGITTRKPSPRYPWLGRSSKVSGTTPWAPADMK